MWLYTSYAVQPHRSVASKNGDFRYHGPKYKVLDVTSGIALASLLTRPPSSHRRCLRRAGPRAPGTGSFRLTNWTGSLFNLNNRASGHPRGRSYRGRGAFGQGVGPRLLGPGRAAGRLGGRLAGTDLGR